MRLEVITLDKPNRKFSRSVQKISRQLEELLKYKGLVEVYLISGRRMRFLNKNFRKKDMPTNVLSFQKPKGFPGNGLGEVYLDPVYIQKHKESLSLMLAHGVLHILGYDHVHKSDRIKMEKKEAKLLSKIQMPKSK